MKLSQLIISLLAISVIGVSAQDEAKRKLARASMTIEGGTNPVYITEVTKGSVQYILGKVISIERAASMDKPKILKKSRVKLDNLYIYEPKEYTKALNLYKSRQYKEALAKFDEVIEANSMTYLLPDNYATLAEFYQIESCRRLLDIKGMKERMAKFEAAPLTRQTQIAQLELFPLWEATLNKDWARLDGLCQQWAKRKLPVSHRAQVEFCHGQALEGLKQLKPALNAYARAMTADFTVSHEIVKQAALNSLALYETVEGIQHEMDHWGKPTANTNSAAYQFLGEAYGLASVYGKANLGGGTPLPAEYKKFLKFQPPHLAKAAKDAAAKKESTKAQAKPAPAEKKSL